MTRRLLALCALVTLASGCRDDFDDFVADPLSADWELVGVEGLAGCTATNGLLQVLEIEGMGFSGDFSWNASCTDGNDIAEAGDVTGVEVDVSGRDYGLDILISTPSTRALDWDCTMSGSELSCVESGDVVVIYEFEKQPG